MNSWTWINGTKIAYGVDSVRQYIPKWVAPKSKVLCTYGGGSIEKNGCKKHIEDALKSISCEVKWEGGIPPNPEYSRLIQIADVARKWKPDLILAVGGGSVADGTKFIALVAKLPNNDKAWEHVKNRSFPAESFKLATVLTLPATGSEWNSGFVISRAETNEKLGCGTTASYPDFSILDPSYTMTLPPRQLRNGLYDAFCHCFEQIITGDVVPMVDRFFCAVMRELVDISDELLKPNSSLEAHSRLMQACSFALNEVLRCGKPGCWGVHLIGHQITAKYGIDHAGTLAMVTTPFLKELKKTRKETLAMAAELVYDVKSGSVDEKADKFIELNQQWIKKIGQPLKVTDWEGAKVESGDVDKVLNMVFDSSHGKDFGYKELCNKGVVQNILKQVVC